MKTMTTVDWKYKMTTEMLITASKEKDALFRCADIEKPFIVPRVGESVRLMMGGDTKTSAMLKKYIVKDVCHHYRDGQCTILVSVEE